MSAVNPYQPPRAHVEDVASDARVQPLRLWSARGRIGRLRYLAWGTGAYLLLALAGGVMGALRVASPAAGGAVGIVAFVAYAVFFVLISIQRAHDMDWSGWSVLLLLIPISALVWIFRGGSEGENGYGAPPPPNTWGVRVLGMLMPLIAIIGIVAAIALPAYQDYTKRAHAGVSGQR
jgi:uncharacterized membrane protein YhaH (DUF805 family)